MSRGIKQAFLYISSVGGDVFVFVAHKTNDTHTTGRAFILGVLFFNTQTGEKTNTYKQIVFLRVQ